MSSRAVIYMNRRSRRGRDWFRAAVEALRAGGMAQLDETVLTHNAEELIARVQAATEREVPLVIVGGGDGTLSSIVRYFVGHRSVLGLIPAGTGNQFARDLGIPSDVQAACRIVRNGVPHPIDLGTVADDYFINVSTIGLTTQIAEALTGNQKRALGRAAYLVALLRGITKLRYFNARIVTPTETHEFRTLQVVVGNGRYHAGPFPLAPDAAITDGQLNIYAVTGTRPLGLLKMALRLPTGTHVDLEEVPAFTATECRIETEPRKRVTVDGEILYRTPVAFGILPKAIQVMVPADFEREAR